LICGSRRRFVLGREAWVGYIFGYKHMDECFYGLVREIRKLRDGGEARGKQQTKKKRCCIM